MEALGRFRAALRSNWRARLQEDEWFLADLQEKVVLELTSAEAFAALDEAVAVLLEQDDAFLRSQSGALMVALARVSDTTAMPPQLDADWRKVLTALADSPHIAQELAGWYRRRGA